MMSVMDILGSLIHFGSYLLTVKMNRELLSGFYHLLMAFAAVPFKYGGDGIQDMGDQLSVQKWELTKFNMTFSPNVGL